MSERDMSTEQPAPPLLRVSATDTERAAPRRWPALLCAAAAGLCWSAALLLLLWVSLNSYEQVLAPLRVVFYLFVLAAGLLTFGPIQRQLQLPGLTLEGVAGTALLFYTLAFLPPPTASLLWLPDAPVYVIFATAVFWTVAAVVLPLVYALGRRVFQQRAHQFDLRRARRQAHGVGALAALCVLLAGLRVLTPLSVLLLALILVVVELMFLSFVEPQA
jgi:hypothetical protein